MRTLLEHARDAQAIRIGPDLSADLKHLYMEDFSGERSGPRAGRAPATLPGRHIAVKPKAQTERTADKALDELQVMIGLGSVKEEVNKLLASLEVEKKSARAGS